MFSKWWGVGWTCACSHIHMSMSHVCTYNTRIYTYTPGSFHINPWGLGHTSLLLRVIRSVFLYSKCQGFGNCVIYGEKEEETRIHNIYSWILQDIAMIWFKSVLNQVCWVKIATGGSLIATVFSIVLYCCVAKLLAYPRMHSTSYFIAYRWNYVSHYWKWNKAHRQTYKGFSLMLSASQLKQ